MPPASPCNGFCSFERRTGYCFGCARTADEIVNWRETSVCGRDEILEQLATRKARLGFVRRLPWSLEQINEFVVSTFNGPGTWVAGVHGAIAAFKVGKGEEVDIEVSGVRLFAKTQRASILVQLSSKVRAYSVNPAPSTDQGNCRPNLSGFVVMAVPRNCGFDRRDEGLMCLGPDTNAITEEDRHDSLYDFGMGNHAGSFGVRTGELMLQRRLGQFIGAKWPAFFPLLCNDLSRAAPTRVVRNPLGRIEVSTPLWSGSTN